MKSKKLTRTETIPIRFTVQEKTTVEKLAIQAHDYPSSFLRRMVLDSIKAKQEIHKEIIT